MGQIVCFSHGGGSLPLLGDAGHAVMAEFMAELPSRPAELVFGDCIIGKRSVAFLWQ